LANLVNAKIKKGFIATNGKPYPCDKAAIHKWKTGIWDDLNIKNKKSYPEEIFEICGFKFNKEKYILDAKHNLNWNIRERRPLVGLNTGCGSRWETRLWPTKNWTALIKKLKKDGFGVILLGGEAEDKKNKELSKKTGASYPGYFPLGKFISLVGQCDVIVTGVTMALHIAVALGKKIVLFNNVFNKNEFELYGLGQILEPELSCLGCYKSDCKDKCMELISPERVYQACKKVLNY
jgi:ADP-heptose:LPS heptosyltransferase